MKRKSLVFLTMVFLLGQTACGAAATDNGNAGGNSQTTETEAIASAEVNAETDNMVQTEATELETEAPTETETSAQDELTEFVNQFADEFFYGTEEGLQPYLAADYEEEVLCHEGETPSDIVINVISPIENDENRQFASVQFVLGEEDSYTYLSMELVNVDGDWYVSSYGVEK